MKKLALLFNLMLLAFGLTAQTNYYFPTEVGTVLTYKNFNAKGKVDKDTPWYTYTITKVEKKGEDTHIFFTVDFKDKEKLDMKNVFDNLEVIIKKDVMEIEFFNSIVGKLFVASMSSEFKDMSVSTSGSNMKYFPLNAETGATIPNTELKITMEMPVQGMNMQSVSIIGIYDSKIVAKEDLTTPAGTFTCLKVSEKLKNTTSMGGMVMQGTEQSNNTWLAKGIGFVKMETYDKKGKLESYLELEKIEKK